MMSVPLIPLGESSQKAVVFDVELKKVQVLSKVFMKPDIIVGLMFEHMNVGPLEVQKLYMSATLFIFQEDEDVERIWITLRSVERSLGHSVNAKCDITTPEQLSVVDQSWQVEKNEATSLDGKNKPFRPIKGAPYRMSSHSATSKLWLKHQN